MLILKVYNMRVKTQNSISCGINSLTTASASTVR